MSLFIARRRLLLTGAALGPAPDVRAQGRDGDVLEIPRHETATIDSRQWDTPMPAA
jgi:hypothetical protein